MTSSTLMVLTQVLLLILFLMNITAISSETVADYFQSVRNCFSSNETMLCLKEQTLQIINETINSDQELDFGMFQITKDASFYSSVSENDIPRDSSRSLALSNAIYEKVEDFFNSRVVKFKLGDVDEARKKGGGLGGGGGGFSGGGGKKGGGGGMLMLGGMAMAGMMAQMFMGKIAFLAGTALLLAKMALVMATIAAFKKSSNDGGSKDSAHVVYASPESHGGGHSYGYGGSWHRSLNPEEIQQNYYQAGYTPQAVTSNMVQYQAKRKRK